MTQPVKQQVYEQHVCEQALRWVYRQGQVQSRVWRDVHQQVQWRVHSQVEDQVWGRCGV